MVNDREIVILGRILALQRTIEKEGLGSEIEFIAAFKKLIAKMEEMEEME
jgi:hypothetical protein